MKSNQNPSDLGLKEHQEIESIIGNPPGWTLRWGLSILTLGFLVLMLFSHLIKYADVIQAKAYLTTENPPIRVMANADAKIAQLKVENGQQVEQGSLLAVLDNPAQYEDVQALASILDSIEKNPANLRAYPSFPNAPNLGSLQDEYARFLQSFQDLKLLVEQDLTFQKIANLRAQTADISLLNKSLDRQGGILQKEVALARQNMERDSSLYARNSVSRLEYDQSQSIYFQKNRELEALRSGTIQNNLRIQQIKGQIIELEESQSETLNARTLAFSAELNRLQGALAEWKATWLMMAPIDGEVVLTKAWSEQQYVKKGEEVMTVVPNEAAGQLVAKALMPYEGSGKVTAGMEAQIRLDGFPYQEFGSINGTVESVAPVPGEFGYELTIEIPDDLLTTYGRAIPFRQEMQGVARIVTEEKSILSRLLNKIISALKN